MIGVSAVTAPPDEAQLTGLTFATVTGNQKAESRASWNQWDVIWSGAVLALILAAYLYFTG
jgi:solute:Na+ symporter, SSS family